MKEPTEKEWVDISHHIGLAIERAYLKSVFLGMALSFDSDDTEERKICKNNPEPSN